jgi:hypothetical protein
MSNISPLKIHRTRKKNLYFFIELKIDLGKSSLHRQYLLLIFGIKLRKISFYMKIKESKGKAHKNN